MCVCDCVCVCGVCMVLFGCVWVGGWVGWVGGIECREMGVIVIMCVCVCVYVCLCM